MIVCQFTLTLISLHIRNNKNKKSTKNKTNKFHLAPAIEFSCVEAQIKKNKKFR